MNGGHEAGFDGAEVIEGLGHGSEAVGGAAGRGDNLVGGLQDLVVDVEDDGREVLAGRGGNNDLAGAGLDVGHGLFLRRIEAGALEHHVDLKIGPGEIGGVLFLVDGDFLAIDFDGRFRGFDGAGELAMGAVVLEKVRKHLRAGQVVDGHDLIFGIFKHLTESETADAAETIDSYSYSHDVKPPGESCEPLRNCQPADAVARAPGQAASGRKIPFAPVYKHKFPFWQRRIKRIKRSCCQQMVILSRSSGTYILPPKKARPSSV